MTPPEQPARDWACTAYGPEVPATCFFQEAGETCTSLEQCQERMKGERQRVYRRMQELAAHGDPMWADISDEFTNPEGLLNADDYSEGDAQ